jgi:hypothetical protein
MGSASKKTLAILRQVLNSDLVNFVVDENFTFFNPKAGLP